VTVTADIPLEAADDMKIEFIYTNGVVAVDHRMTYTLLLNGPAWCTCIHLFTRTQYIDFHQHPKLLGAGATNIA
jgi:hypothetical protein